MRKALVALFFAALALLPMVGRAQEINISFGAGALQGTPIDDLSGDHSPQNVGGGTFLSFAGEYIFKKNFGVGGEIAWRAGRSLYAGQVEFRPLFYDFNAIYAPRLSDRVSADLMAGIGVESVRFYEGFVTCDAFTGVCTDYVSSNHFLGHFGAGLRMYPKGNFFIRPEAHLYLVRNNFEFSGPRAARFSVSIGYTLGGNR